MKKITQKNITFIKYNSYFMIIVAVISLFFILQDFYKSIQSVVPHYGWIYYMIRPIFAHKISELYIGYCWFFIAILSNYEKINMYPSWMPKIHYAKILYYSAIGMIPAIILAVYAWTQINFGTHQLSTNYMPLVETTNQLEVFVWRYYLAALVIAGGFYLKVMYKKAIILLTDIPDKTK